MIYTFLFTDIEGSTRLAQALGAAWPGALADHHRIVREQVAKYGGREMGNAGDGFALVFDDPAGAVGAAVAVQREIAVFQWREDYRVRVRMGLHTGHATEGESGWAGLTIHQCARISAAAHGDQVLLSSITADLIPNRLPDGVSLRDLGRHRLKDLGEPLHLLQLVVGGLADDRRPPTTLDPSQHNLPVQLSTFVGREDDVLGVEKRLAEARIVTLVGPGGVGKSRLAIQSGAAVLQSFPGGVWLVELAPLDGSEFVEVAIAAALGVRQEPFRSLADSIVERLDPGTGAQCLLILDNCDHVLDGVVAACTALLATSPALSVLATSVEPLRMPGEVLQPVAPLRVSFASEAGDGAAFTGEMPGPAVRLFAERAVAADAGFSLDPETAATVMALCERLDGLPLAIELAAARSATLTPAQLLDRLEDRFVLLTTGPRSAEARHRTLRAVVEWSVGLLSEAERDVLAHLAVFRGGCTLAAAEAVVGSAGLVDSLAGLIDRSLVFARGAGRDRRYLLLETIRAYGEERLADRHDLEPTRDRHLEWIAALAAEAAPELTGGNQAHWMDLLEAELDNLRRSLEWSCAEPARAAAGLTVAASLVNFWMARGLRAEGIGWVERLVRVADAEPFVRVHALFGSAVLAVFSWPSSARPLADLALELCGDDPPARGLALALQALCEVFAGDLAVARDRYRQAQELLPEGVPGEDGVSVVANSMSVFFAMRDDSPTALHLLSDLRARLVALGDRHLAGGVQSMEAMVLHFVGEDADAADAAREALMVASEFGCVSCRSQALTAGAVLPGEPLGDRQRALVEALELSDGIGEMITVVLAVEGLAVLDHEANDPERALRLAAAARGLRARTGLAFRYPGVTDRAERAEAAARLAIAPDHADRVAIESEGLSYSAVLALARGVVTS